MSEPGCVLFDLDGVLARHDTFVEFVRRRCRSHPWVLPPVALMLPAMAAARYSPRLRRHPASWAAQAAMLGTQRQLLQQHLYELGAELAADPRWRVAAACARIEDHLSCGHRVIVVTATQHHLARGYLDGLGLPAVELLASQLQEAARGCRLKPHNYGMEKARLLAGLVPPPWATLYTDSLADLPLMRRVNEVVLVNADDRLRQSVAAKGISVAVEQWH